MKKTLRLIELIGPFTITYLAFAPFVRAVDPPADGGYPNQNTAEGEDALLDLTGGFFNTAIGYHALSDDPSGSLNTALGAQALLLNTTGMSNTASGSQALLSNSTGGNNTATGANALLENNGNNKTAMGASALLLNISGPNNTATGANALENNSTGSGNTAMGRGALSSNSSGNNNIAVGLSAGRSLTTGDNNIDIGNRGVTGESNTIRIGTVGAQSATYIAGISGATVADGVAVVVGANGHLGTVISSSRYKEAIRPMNKASEAILSLQPVTFHYKRDLDPSGIPQFGLVAEEVAKINPDLVAGDAQGKPYTVRYEAVNAMLLNEFLKEHRKVQNLQAKVVQQESTNTELREEIAALKATLKEQATQIQKVSTQLALSRPMPRVVTTP